MSTGPEYDREAHYECVALDLGEIDAAGSKCYGAAVVFRSLCEIKVEIFSTLLGSIQDGTDNKLKQLIAILHQLCIR